MATRRNQEKKARSRTPNKTAVDDEPADQIESNNPDDGSPLDPDGPIVDPVESINPEEPGYPDDDNVIDPIESNDPADPRSPVNRIREPGNRNNESIEDDTPIDDPERQPGTNSRNILSPPEHP